MDPTETESFHMVFHNEGLGVLEALQRKELLPIDVTVLTAAMLLTDHKTGVLEISLTELGRRIGQKQPNVSNAIKRLRLQQLVATGYEPTSCTRIVMVNPYLCGRRDDTRRFNVRWGRFKALINGD
jgi:DNA-binding MarR family transcriptional regulator